MIIITILFWFTFSTIPFTLRISN